MSLGFHKVMETLVWLRDAGQTHLWSPGRLWNSDRQWVPAKPFIALHRWPHTVVGLCGIEEARSRRKKWDCFFLQHPIRSNSKCKILVGSLRRLRFLQMTVSWNCVLITTDAVTVVCISDLSQTKAAGERSGVLVTRMCVWCVAFLRPLRGS